MINECSLRFRAIVAAEAGDRIDPTGNRRQTPRLNDQPCSSPPQTNTSDHCRCLQPRAAPATALIGPGAFQCSGSRSSPPRLRPRPQRGAGIDRLPALSSFNYLEEFRRRRDHRSDRRQLVRTWTRARDQASGTDQPARSPAIAWSAVTLGRFGRAVPEILDQTWRAPPVDACGWPPVGRPVPSPAQRSAHPTASASLADSWSRRARPRLPRRYMGARSTS